jgi:hypothetical protein
MTVTNRTKLLTVLAELSAACPEMRFGQLIANLSTLAKGMSADGLWDVEDDELLAAARKQLEYFTEHRTSLSNEPAAMSGSGEPRA